MVETATANRTEADRAWFAEQIDDLLPELYGAAVRLCRDRTEGEDLVAECVEKAWRGLPSLRDRAAFRGWVFRILNNAFLSQRRALRSRVTQEPLESVSEFSLFERLHQPILLWWGNPETQFVNRLLREDLERAIDALPDSYRVVVVLVELQGLAYREVAEVLDVPIGTVRSRLARGRSQLQEALWEHATEQGLTRQEGNEE